MNREHVKKTAVDMVKKTGLINLSRLELCKKAGIPDGSFPHIMGCTFSDFLKELNRESNDTKTHIVTKNRVNPKLRKEQILNVALDMARSDGYDKITRDAIAKKAGVSMGVVTKHFGTMKKLRRSLMRAAVHREILQVVLQGLVNNDPAAKKAPEKLKSTAINSMLA